MNDMPREEWLSSLNAGDRAYLAEGFPRPIVSDAAIYKIGKGKIWIRKKDDPRDYWVDRKTGDNEFFLLGFKIFPNERLANEQK